jgi:hypothetical protein
MLENTPLYLNNAAMLTSVRKLTIDTGSQLSDTALAELSCLMQLESFNVILWEAKAAAAASAAWRQLPQLQNLQIYMYRSSNDDNQVENQAADAEEAEQVGHAVLQGLAAATQLTWLYLNLDLYDMQCGSALAQLTNLQGLHLHGSPGVLEDMLQLRALIQLKSLSLTQCGMDGTAAAALLCRLTGLQHLKLSSCRKVTDAVVPVIGAQLRGLHSLGLFYMPAGFGDTSVQLLVELTQLKSMSLCEVGLTREGAVQLRASAPFCIADLIL